MEELSRGAGNEEARREADAWEMSVHLDGGRGQQASREQKEVVRRE